MEVFSVVKYIVFEITPKLYNENVTYISHFKTSFVCVSLRKLFILDSEYVIVYCRYLPQHV